MLPPLPEIRIPLALACLALAASDASTALQTGPEPAGATAAGHRVSPRAEPCLRLRIAASSDAAAVDCLPPGVRLSVTTRRGDWSWVELASGIEGWVASEYLDAEGAAVPPRVADSSTGAPSDAGASGTEPVEPPAAAPLEPGAAGPLRRDAPSPDDADAREAELTVRLIETGGRLEHAEARVAELARELATARQSATDLEAQAGELRTRNEELAAALNASRQAATANQEQVVELRSRSQQIGVELDGARQRITALEEQLAAARRASSLDTLAAADRDARSAELAEALEQQGHRLAAAEARAAELTSELAAARGQTAAAEAWTAELSAELEELRSRAATAEATAEALTAHDRRLEADLAGTSRALAAAEERNARLAAELEELRSRAAAAEERLAERSAELAEARLPSGPDPHPRAPSETAPRRAPAGDPAEAALAAVRAWAAAWSEQRLDDYLAAYSIAFQPPAGLSRLEWEAQRRRRLTAPAHIQIELSELEAAVRDPRTVAVGFRQEYRSDRFRDTVRKRLTMAFEQGRWKIRKEEVTE